MNTRKPIVLIAPLDWGLGHTIRCIPIIRELLKQECEVLVGCNSKQKQILSADFPQLRFVDLQGYDIHYGRSRWQTLLKLFLQTTKILTRINEEQAWLKNLLKTNKVDAIISDNRYGLFSNHIPCVFITHQLAVKSGLAKLIDQVVQRRLYAYINKYSICWVPDLKASQKNLAGELSHPRKLPKITVQYIGPLTRLKGAVITQPSNDVAIILSGPEPQRTILEEIIVNQLRQFEGSGILVRGVFNETRIDEFNDIKIVNYLNSNELNNLICNSNIIICRAGYTSIMDMLILDKKAIFIPTPGQAEQEYLARHIESQNLGFTSSQKKFRLVPLLNKMKTSSGVNTSTIPGDQYKLILEEFCRSLKG